MTGGIVDMGARKQSVRSTMLHSYRYPVCYTPGRDIAVTRHRVPRGRQDADSAAAPAPPSPVFQTMDVKRILGCVNAFDLVGFRHGERLAATGSDVFVSRNSSPLFFADTRIPGAFALSVFTFAFRIFVYLTPPEKRWKLLGNDDFLESEDTIFFGIWQ